MDINYVVGRWGGGVCLAEIADGAGSLLGIGKAFAGIGAAEAEDTGPFYVGHVEDELLSRRTGSDTDLRKHLTCPLSENVEHRIIAYVDVSSLKRTPC